MVFVIKWNKKAVMQFDDLVKYIEQDSPVAAQKVKREILLKIDSLLRHPEKFNPDKFKLNNDGTFRAFEMYGYRISYRCILNDIRLIRIRQTKMNPAKY